MSFWQPPIGSLWCGDYGGWRPGSHAYHAGGEMGVLNNSDHVYDQAIFIQGTVGELS